MADIDIGLAELLALPEGKTLDFKRDLSGTKGIRKALVAFANTSGGTLVIGVDDDKTVRGLADPLKDEEKLASLISDTIRPALLPDIELTTHDGKHVLLVRVARALGPFYLEDEGPEEGVYIRVGSTSRKADAAAIAELKRSLLSESFDQLPSLSGRSGLDEARLTSALRPHGIPTTDAKLVTLGVLTTHQDKRLASHGGLILFGRDEERQKHFPDARVRCVVFAGETKAADILDQLDLFDSTIIEAADLVERFIKRNTRLAGPIKGLRRKDTPEYSEVMIREILVNALAHADYSLIGMQVKVAIYSNRIEIENPGFLPFGMTLEHLRAGQSKIRNRVIARVFNEIELLDGWGRAWEKILAAMEVGYPEPEFVELGAAFKVTLWPHPVVAEIADDGRSKVDEGGKAVDEGKDGSGEGVKLTASERRDWILNRIDTVQGVKGPDVMSGLGISKATAERDLRALVRSGDIEYVGSRKTGHYVRSQQTSMD